MFEATLNLLWDSSTRAVQEEVKPTLGYTEPISLVLAATVASPELDDAVGRIDAQVSPNLMKNGMGVTVPGAGIVGLPITAALSALEGNAHAGLEVLKDASPQAITDAKAMLNTGKVAVILQEPYEDILFSRTKIYSAERWAYVTIVGSHTSVVHIKTNKDVAFTIEQNAQEEEQESPLAVLSYASLEEIPASVNAVPFESIRFILDAAKLNDALSQGGLRGNWGLHVGTTLEKQCTRDLLANDLSTSILIRTSAASDARMGGATLPTMSNSGSGNQNITTTVPVMVVAGHFGADEGKPTCALMLSHPSTIYTHHQLPHLSALYAAAMAAMGVIAGMAWIIDGRYNTIAMAVSNMIGDMSGMICDGVSNSCAIKVPTSASAAWKAILVALDDTAATGNEGIMTHNVEQSIANLCALACRSVQKTGRQIIKIVISKAH